MGPWAGADGGTALIADALNVSVWFWLLQTHGRTWPVAKSTFNLYVLSVRPSAPPHPLVQRQGRIVHSGARLRLCVRLPSDHKEGHRACAYVCVCVCLSTVIMFGCKFFHWCTHYGEHLLYKACTVASLTQPKKQTNNNRNVHQQSFFVNKYIEINIWCTQVVHKALKRYVQPQQINPLMWTRRKCRYFYFPPTTISCKQD